MTELIELLKKSPWLFLFFIVVMAGKVYFDNSIEVLKNEITNVGSASLVVKQQLREQERAELLAFREAIVRWEHYIQDSTPMLPELLMKETGVNDYYSGENERFLEIEVHSVRLSTLIRDDALSQRVLDIKVRMRKLYHPIMHDLVNTQLDINAQITPLEDKLEQFLKQDPAKPTITLTPEIQQQHRDLLRKRVEAQREFLSKLEVGYQAMHKELLDLNKAINTYIYRPIEETDVDKA